MYIYIYIHSFFWQQKQKNMRKRKHQRCPFDHCLLTWLHHVPPRRSSWLFPVEHGKLAHLREMHAFGVSLAVSESSFGGGMGSQVMSSVTPWRIHGAAIYGNIYHQYTPNHSIYASTMDPMGTSVVICFWIVLVMNPGWDSYSLHYTQPCHWQVGYNPGVNLQKLTGAFYAGNFLEWSQSSLVITIPATPFPSIPYYHRIGWWENLQENYIIIFDSKNHGFPVKIFP